MTEKACTRCRAIKRLDEFSPDRRASDGKQSQCKACAARRHAAHRAAHPEVRQRQLDYYADWYQSNRLVVDTRSAEWRAEKQRKLTSAARNAGKEWTGPELELAADLRRTTEDVARVLGRTWQSVNTIRVRIRRDPRKARLAGTDT